MNGKKTETTLNFHQLPQGAVWFPRPGSLPKLRAQAWGKSMCSPGKHPALPSARGAPRGLGSLSDTPTYLALGS